jgi:pseudaminic acid synthase
MYFKKNFNIGKVKIGENNRALIVAEISANHKNNLKTIKKLIISAKKSGADLIKIQTYTPDSLTINSKKKDFKIKKKNPWSKNKTFWNLYEKSQTTYELTDEIFKYCKKFGIEVFSTPFDEDGVDFLEKYNVPAYKIASPEICHIPLIEKVAKTGKPIILSLGLASIEDIKLALRVIKKNRNRKVVLLQCVASYPAPIDEQNISAINVIKKKFGVLSGLSDHTDGFIASLTAVASGANLIEKHFNLKNNDSIDSFFSSNQYEFKTMVDNIRYAESSMGDGNIKISKSSKVNLNSRRSIYVSQNIKKGTVLNDRNIKIVRPGYGLHPKYYTYLLKKEVNRSLKKGDRFKLEYVNKT